ncbi:MAG: prolyl oligopeptidase family serine peptidase [Cytophagaceae bacterium]|nr:prolyl oligopeptidase family serine peptidase [Cytophagaceae bacterium]
MKTVTCLLVFLMLIPKVQAQNYEEAKVPAYTLPDPLLSLNKVRIKTKTEWETTRRPELLRLFADHVYGRSPTAYSDIKFTVTNENKVAMEGRAYLKEVRIDVTQHQKTVAIHLILFLPNRVSGPAPAFLLINNRGKENTDPTRATKSDFWPAEMLIDQGFAVAAFHVSDAAPDDKTTFQNGVLQLYPDLLAADNGMRTLGAWAWGASRAMDYLQQEARVDKNKVAVIGHSRGGKAALWCAAQDQRFALVVSNCSGTGGASLARRQFGETVQRINTTFPHWFTPKYKQYGDNEAALPVDQHLLMALMAPRPVYVGTAVEDRWADPLGSFLALKNAETVYALYGVGPLPSATQPQVNTPVIESRLGYHLREGVHNLTRYDWTQYLAFARYHFEKH